MIVDAAERAAAIDVSRSCIIQAPAGSGKTELLIQRLLALFGQVEKPQQVLAITFTNKAAGEMRARLLQALRSAATAPRPEQPHAATTWTLARKALDNLGTDLLNNPAQLAIQTIDSFHAALVRRMPWSTRFGGVPEISDDPTALYLAATDQLLTRLDTDSPGNPQLLALIRHLDNQVQFTQQMLIDLLRHRDQWLRYLRQDVETSHHQLQQALEQLYVDQIRTMRRYFPAHLADDLLACFNFSASQRAAAEQGELKLFATLPADRYQDLEAWHQVADLLLTSSGDLRKTVTKAQGFPAGKERKREKEQMLQLLENLQDHSSFVDCLEAVRRLPSGGYAEEQWQVLQSLIELLPLLLYELWNVFRAQGQVDFVEVALKAGEALGAADNPSDLLLQLDQDLRHILVDEFQDTSRLQYELLDTLTAGWTAGDGRTLFLVGDPMQSIYLFREAEVGLFLHCCKGEFGENRLPLQYLRLKSNFRSQPGIVSWVNDSFARIFPRSADQATGAVPLSEAVAVQPVRDPHPWTFHAFPDRDDQGEAQKIIELISLAQQEDPQQTIAVLVRSRNHLQALLPLLREKGIAYQARDIELLGARPAALDIVHLTRALFHRADRLSWLAVLRAPWCGLTLHDLHLLAGEDPVRTLPELLHDTELLQKLSGDGQQRLERCLPILELGMRKRGRLPLRALVEGCWLSLGGPSCYQDHGISDAGLVFELLEKLDQGGVPAGFDQLEQGLEKIFSEPATTDARVQIMTIHKAKGLEFDTVIIPGLGRRTQRTDSPLLRWQEHPRHGLLIAPINARGTADRDPLYQLIGRLQAEKEDLESSRLLYVAVTRAIRSLHLLGTASQNKNGDYSPAKGSLLEKLWPMVQQEFVFPRTGAPGAEPAPAPAMLKRLSTNWCMPQVKQLSVADFLRTESPSAAEDPDTKGPAFSGWENPVQREIGTLVHHELDVLARYGIDAWQNIDEQRRQTMLRRSLQAKGFADPDLATGVTNAFAALSRVISSKRGRWVLEKHPEHRCEMPVTGVINGTVVRAVIDRTFVADGQRWVIDYKTSAPLQGEPEDDFLRREGDRYRLQLNSYVQLLSQLFPGDSIRAALYFPMIDAWYEL